MRIIFITKKLILRMKFVLGYNLRQRHHHNSMRWLSISEGYLNALRDFRIITDDEYFKLGIEFGLFKKMKEKFEGCATCDVGTFDGFIDGLYEYTCRSAHLGIDDNFNYSPSYAHLKEGEKYPEWCPEKDEIIKEVNLNE